MKFAIILGAVCIVSALALPLEHEVHQEGEHGERITLKKVGDKIVKHVCKTVKKVKTHIEHTKKEVKECHPKEVCHKVEGWDCVPLDPHDPNNHSKKCDPKKECHHEEECEIHHIEVPHEVEEIVPVEHCEDKIFELKHTSSSSSSHHPSSSSNHHSSSSSSNHHRSSSSSHHSFTRPTFHG